MDAYLHDAPAARGFSVEYAMTDRFVSDVNKWKMAMAEREPTPKKVWQPLRSLGFETARAQERAAYAAIPSKFV